MTLENLGNIHPVNYPSYLTPGMDLLINKAFSNNTHTRVSPMHLLSDEYIPMGHQVDHHTSKSIFENSNSWNDILTYLISGYPQLISELKTNKTMLAPLILGRTFITLLRGSPSFVDVVIQSPNLLAMFLSHPSLLSEVASNPLLFAALLSNPNLQEVREMLSSFMYKDRGKHLILPLKNERFAKLTENIVVRQQARPIITELPKPIPVAKSALDEIRKEKIVMLKIKMDNGVVRKEETIPKELLKPTINNLLMTLAAKYHYEQGAGRLIPYSAGKIVIPKGKETFIQTQQRQQLQQIQNIRHLVNPALLAALGAAVVVNRKRIIGDEEKEYIEPGIYEENPFELEQVHKIDPNDPIVKVRHNE